MNMPLKTFALTTLVLIGMAGNSLLARAALGGHLIGPLSFTMIRLVSGCIMLLMLAFIARVRPRLSHKGMPVTLLLYALAFAYGYLQLGAATGTLFLFFAIQATILCWEMFNGYRLSTGQWLGSGLSVWGLWILVGGVSGLPDMIGIMLMIVAGISWGLYSMLGKNVVDSLAVTTANFIWSGLIASLVFAAVDIFALGDGESVYISVPGLYYALVVGAVTSALVYVLWYILVQKLSGVTSASVQMAVPAVVLLGAAPLLGEPVTRHSLIGGTIIISGLSLVTLTKHL